MGFTTDQMANGFYQYTIEHQNYHRFEETNRVCKNCGRKLGIYYCENQLYAVRCMHCEIVTLVKAPNPILAIKKVGKKREDMMNTFGGEEDAEA